MPHISQLLKHIKFPRSQADYAQAQRLFHGRGHAFYNLNHVTVDWLPPVALITLFAPEPIDSVEQLADGLLSKLCLCKSVQLQHRYQSHGPVDVIRGESITQLTILEGDLKFHIRLGQNRNTGLFLDMKNGRNWVKKHSQDKRVLNLFAYTCGFSVAAITGGAKSVLNIDMSSAALHTGRENHRLNQQSIDQVRFEKLNIFKSFGRLKKRGPFDLLICDPPTFQKGSVDITRDYPKIMRRLTEFMAPGSTLMLCLNSPDLTAGFLIENVDELAPHYQLTQEIRPPNVYIDAQDKGLKVLIFSNG